MECLQKNPAYKKILSEECVMTNATLAEVYTVLRRKIDEKTADYWTKQFSTIAKSINTSIWLQAVKMKIKHGKEHLSLYDCLGYVFAQENKYIFVTGDNAFKNKKGVKYLK